MKTTPAPAHTHEPVRCSRRFYCLECGKDLTAERGTAASLSEFLAQLRAADARSARRFEGL